MSFNSLLDAATRLDADMQAKQAWMMRAAYHADAKQFEGMMKKMQGTRDDEPKKGLRDLMTKFGGGF